MVRPERLSDEERATYEWQMWVPDFGESGQEKLKGATVLVLRIGGLGSVVAYELAAAGVGRLILAHVGNIRPSDLNRQLLMTYAGLGQPRVEVARRRLLDLNPRLRIERLLRIFMTGTPIDSSRRPTLSWTVLRCLKSGLPWQICAAVHRGFRWWNVPCTTWKPTCSR